MKRWITFTLLILFSFAQMPTDGLASSRDRDRGGNAAMKMKASKRSKYTAKMRRQQDKDRKKHLADIRKSQPKKKGSASAQTASKQQATTPAQEAMPRQEVKPVQEVTPKQEAVPVQEATPVQESAPTMPEEQ